MTLGGWRTHPTRSPRRATLLPRLAATPAAQQLPYTSTIVFLVRKAIRKASGTGHLVRWASPSSRPIPRPPARPLNYLAAWATRKSAMAQSAAREFVRNLYANVPVWTRGARAQRRHLSSAVLASVYLALKTRRFSREGTRPDRVRLSCRRSHPRRAARRARRQVVDRKGTGKSPRRIRLLVHGRRPEIVGEELLIVRSILPWRRNTTSVRQVHCFH